MKRPAVKFALLVLLSVVAGFVFAKAQKDFTTAFEQRTAPAPTRTVPVDWRENRLAPGHAVHVINQTLECNDCHDPEEPSFDTPDTGVCTACHTEQTSHWHTGVPEAPTECYTCHSFKASDEINSRWDCTRCHGPFDTEHLRGLSMHTSMGCENCHNPHRPVEETAEDCDSCHKPIRVKHGKPSLSGTCSGCHGGHKLASEAAACMDCHARKEPIVPQTATFDGHESCANCHKAHSFSVSTALSCNRCHRGVKALAQAKTSDHRKCNSCHEPHAARVANDRTCTGCHSKVKSKHPLVQNKGECTSCHKPHPKNAAHVALKCASCHDEARSERAFHSNKTTCTDCHEPHAFDLSNVSEQALCKRCHAKQVRLVNNKDHESCESCHQGTVHALSGLAACRSCHEKLHEKSPKGHRDCTSCHEPHSGAVAAKTACTSCHKLQELPGLHRIEGDSQGPGHRECTACHEMHMARVKADRASCMSCHEGIANHEPDAKRCTGCHTFRD